MNPAVVHYQHRMLIGPRVHLGCLHKSRGNTRSVHKELTSAGSLERNTVPGGLL
jgi:hypothetical protein